MILLNDKHLEYSPVVANNRMNRERQAFGINSYEKDILFKLIGFLEECLQNNQTVWWMDLCCGKGNALIQASYYFYEKNLHHSLKFEGLDLVGMFSEKPGHLDFLTLEQGSAIDWQPEKKYHLITCVHGLHYIGDKLKVIQTAMQNLTKNGIFLANLDLNNISVSGSPDFSKKLKKIFRENGLHYTKNHILTCHGHKNPDFGLVFAGADDQAGANYTRQEAVNSYYLVKNP